MVSSFSYSNLVQNLQACHSNLSDVHYHNFTEAMLEFAYSFAYLGKGLGFAYDDVTSKAEAIRRNFNRQSEYTGLQSFIMDEIRRNVTRNNDSSNPSTARTVLRLMWLLDFLLELLKSLLVKEHKKLSKLCSKAYDAALGPHHPWPVRMAAKVGMKLVPNREAFVERLCGPNRSKEEQIRMINELGDAAKPIRDVLWEFYREHKLTELP